MNNFVDVLRQSLETQTIRLRWTTALIEKLIKEKQQLTKERDEARREVCNCSVGVGLKATSQAVAMETKLLSLNQLAEITGLPTAWLKREADEGRIPCIRADRRRMFNLQAVLKVLTDRQSKVVDSE